MSTPKEIALLQIYEILKENYEENDRRLADIVSELMYINQETAARLWIELFIDNLDYAQGDGFCLVTYIILGCRKNYWPLISCLLSDDVLSHYVFGECADCGGTSSVIQRMVGMRNDYANADRFLSLMYQNKNKNCSFAEILEQSIPDGSINFGESPTYPQSISKEAFAMFLSWIEKLDNKKQKAQVYLKLLNFVGHDYSQPAIEETSSGYVVLDFPWGEV